MSEKLNLTLMQERTGAEGDIVFVHGLGGDAIDTWTCDKSDNSKYWPQWIVDSLPNWEVWSLGYPAHKTNWTSTKKGRAIPLTDRAESVIGLLGVRGLGKRPLVFIAHSLGGLLVKKIIQYSDNFGVDGQQQISSNTVAVIFLATPNQGSNLANVADALARVPLGPIPCSWVLRWTPLVKDLRRNSDSLRELHRWYANNARRLGITTVSFFETEPIGSTLVVDEMSANPGVEGAVTRPVDANHFTICKFPSKDNATYLEIHQTLVLLASTLNQMQDLSIEAHLGSIIEWPLPLVSECNPYELLGIKRSDEVDQFNDSPPYIPRDVDVEFDNALSKHSFVLITGRSTSGKSRSAFEALKRSSGIGNVHMLIPERYAPQDLRGLAESWVEYSERPDVAVLWLDDCERYLSEYLNPRTLRQLARMGVKVIGTIRDEEYEQLIERSRKTDDVAKRIDELINQLHTVHLPTITSRPEAARASGIYPLKAFRKSIGESFYASEQLRHRFDSGPDSGRAVAAMAIDWQRMGLSSAINIEHLRRGFDRYYLESNPLGTATDMLYADGLAWCCEQITRHAAILKRVHDSHSIVQVTADESLVGYIQQRRSPLHDFSWSWALEILQSEKDASGYFELGISAFFHDNLPIARCSWELGMDLGHGGAALNFGMLLKIKNDLNGARKAWKRGMELGHGGAALGLGNLLKDQKDVDGARQAYERGVELGDGKAAANLGVLLVEQDELESARQVLEHGIELGEGGAALSLGTLLKNQNDLNGAREAWERGIELGFWVASANLGALLKDQNELDGAREVWEYGAEMGDDSSAHNLGLLLEEKDELNGAIQAYERSIELGGRGSLLNLGILLKKQNDLTGARKAWESAIALGVGGAASFLGKLLEEQNDFDGAQKALECGVTLDQSDAALNLGILLKDNRDFEGARNAWERGMALHDGGSANNLGILLEEQGDLDGARKSWERGIELKDGGSAHNLGMMLKDQNDFDGAWKALECGIDLGFSKSALTLGELLIDQQNFEGAQKALERGVELGDGRAARNLGNLLYDQNDIDGACKAHELGIELGDGGAAANLGILLVQYKNDVKGAEKAWERGKKLGDATSIYNLDVLLSKSKP